MPSGASSRASARVTPSSADLLAEYAARPGREIQFIVDAILITRPYPFPFMWGTKERHMRKTLVKLVLSTSCHSSRVNSTRGLRRFIPALLIRIWPICRTCRPHRARAQVPGSHRRRLPGRPAPRCRHPPPACATASNCSRWRETSAKRAPALPSDMAMALPSPLPAPVITANSPMSNFLSLMIDAKGSAPPTSKHLRITEFEVTTLWKRSPQREKMTADP